MNDAFTPATLASDLDEVSRVYAGFFAGLAETWDEPSKRGPDEWTAHQAVAHLSALNGAGLESIKYALRGEHYEFEGLDDRYAFDAYNLRGIHDHIEIPRPALEAEMLGIIDEAAAIARNLRPDQADTVTRMPIYNRPVRIDEALSILIFHTGLGHTAQVTEPAGVEPLWRKVSPGFRHRLVTRTVLPLSLLYRADFGGELRARIAFRIRGPEGGDWYVDVAPNRTAFGEGRSTRADLVIHLRDTAAFCRMMTGRLNVPLSIATGRMLPRGALRLFKRMDTLFSVTARPDHEPELATMGGRSER